MTDAIAQARTVSQLLDEALKLARRHFRSIFVPVAVPLALGSAAIPLAQVVMARSFASVQRAGRSDFGAVVPGFVLFFAMLMLAIVVMVIGNGALMVGATQAVSGCPVRMAEAWRTMLRPRSLGTLLLATLITVAGFMLCVVPGVYAALALAPLVVVMADENRGGLDALRRCRDVMAYNPLGGLGNHPRVRVFLVLVVGALLGYTLSMVVQMPLMVVQQVILFRKMSSGHQPDPFEMMSSMAWLSVPSQMLGTLVQTAVQVYTAFGLVLLYFDVRSQKEGTDLEAAIRSLAAGPPPAPDATGDAR